MIELECESDSCVAVAGRSGVVDLAELGSWRTWAGGRTGITNTFTYYKNNLLKTAANANGTISTFFNSANWLTNIVGVAPSSTVRYVYHPAGQQSNVLSVAGTVTYAIDAADRLSSLTSPNGKFNYTYNTNNGLISEVNCTVKSQKWCKFGFVPLPG